MTCLDIADILTKGIYFSKSKWSQIYQLAVQWRIWKSTFKVSEWVITVNNLYTF